MCFPVREPEVKSVVVKIPIPAPKPDPGPPATDWAFEKVLNETLMWEGGKDDDPHDPGGRTAYGIIQREYDAWRVKNGYAKRDVWAINQIEVRVIYRENYWEPLGCAQYPPATAYAVFDYGVNSGNRQAVRDSQRVCKMNDVDGVLGPVTIAAIKACDPRSFVIQLDQRRLNLLENLSTWQYFGKGWSERINGGRDFAITLLK